MVEGSSPGEAPPKKPSMPMGLSISVPDDETPEKKKDATDSQQPASASASGRVSAKGEPSGRTSARGEGASGRVSGRHSARGGVSARGSGIPKSVFCHEAVIKGNVIFGEGCIVHPGAQIKADGGDIIMGDFNIIEEYVQITNQVRKDQSGNVVKRTMRIGNYNTFEVASVVDSSEVGDLNEFGVKSSVMPGCVIGNACYINPTVQVPAKSRIPSHSVYIEPGVISTDSQLRDEQRRSYVKEISMVLSDSIPQHLKTQIKDANGVWQPIEPQPKTSATNRTATRTGGSKQGGVSARGTGQTSARNTGQSSARGNTSARAAGGQAQVRTKMPAAAATTTNAATPGLEK